MTQYYQLEIERTEILKPVIEIESDGNSSEQSVRRFWRQINYALHREGEYGGQRKLLRLTELFKCDTCPELNSNGFCFSCQISTFQTEQW